MTDTSADPADPAGINDIVSAGVVRRDSVQWDELPPVFHDDGVMSATWRQSSSAEFVAGSRANWERGVFAQHFLGGTAINLCSDADRAIAQTGITISQRAPVYGTLVDVVCIGRFYDFFARRNGRRASSYASRSTNAAAGTRWYPARSSRLMPRGSPPSPTASAISPTCRPSPV